MKFRVAENSVIANIASIILKENNMAIVLGSTIYLHQIKKIDFLNSKKHFAHEMHHIKQFAKHGTICFLFLYLIESIKNGYWNNKYEIEARDAENEIE